MSDHRWEAVNILKQGLFFLIHLRIVNFFFQENLASPSLELKNLVDPIFKLRDPCVDAGLVLLCTTNAPADDPGEHEPSVWPLDHHWAAAVTLESKKILFS